MNKILLSLIALSLVLGVSLSAPPANAALGMCGKRDEIVKALNGKFKESRKAIAFAGQPTGPLSVVEVFSSKEGTWTVLFTTPEGKTCIIRDGHSLENAPPNKNLIAS